MYREKTNVVGISSVLAHLAKFDSGLRFNIENYSYGLEKLKFEDWKCYRTLFEDSDIDRITMADNFRHITSNTNKLSNLMELKLILKEKLDDRGKRIGEILYGGSKHSKGINLLSDVGFEIVVLGVDLNEGPLFMMDGTHKIIAHYLSHNKSIENVPVYVCVHPDIRSWSWFPK